MPLNSSRWLHLCYVNFTLAKNTATALFNFIKFFYHLLLRLISFWHPCRLEIQKPPAVYSDKETWVLRRCELPTREGGAAKNPSADSWARDHPSKAPNQISGRHGSLVISQVTEEERAASFHKEAKSSLLLHICLNVKREFLSQRQRAGGWL